METGFIVSVMPPDVRSPVGGMVNAGIGTHGLKLGCTQGRTPGAYGFVVSCDLTGYVGARDVVASARLVLTQSGLIGIDPLSNKWSSSVGPGPAKMQLDMVRVTASLELMERLIERLHD